MAAKTKYGKCFHSKDLNIRIPYYGGPSIVAHKGELDADCSIGYHCIAKPMSFDHPHYHAFPEMLCFIGGNPEKAKRQFQRAFELSKSKLLVGPLMYAKFYAVQIQDKALFVKTLNEIVATPKNSFPERNLANEVAKRKAKDLLEKVDTLF